ncbi:MAG: hypothetical protein AB7N71_07070 [Phycisphaerae bacterium]
MKKLKVAAVLLTCGVGTAITANAGVNMPVLQNGTYELNNHPDGAIRPPTYGLRLDGLDGNNQHNFTFDFDNDASDMRMTLNLNNGSIRIFGTTYGGRDMGTAYQNPSMGATGLWQVDFTYNANVSVRSDGAIVVAESQQNSGYIQPLFASNLNAFANNAQIPLVDFMDPSFLLDTNHRGFAGVSGWGWVNHSGNPHVYSSDWLFTVGASAIPSPGAASLGMIGLTLASVFRRRGS